MSAKRRWDCSAVVFINGETVAAQDSFGGVIAEGAAGEADADVVQAAIDEVHPAGQIRICRGTYVFRKPVVIYNSSTIAGEGRGTVIVPPATDYAFKLMTCEKTQIYRPFHGDPGPLYAVIIRDLTIDSESNGSRGKGIYMDHFWSSSFENLWIQNTGNALFMRHSRESDFSNIYLIANGDAEAKEASVIMTAENNNIHFRGLYVIYPNYIGMELIGTRRKGVQVPRLVFIAQSMFHGWLRDEGAARYDLISIRDLDAHRVGCLADVVIRDSRITVAGKGHSSVNVVNSPVTIADSVITASQGKCVIRASQKARVKLTGNTFHSGSATGSEYCLYAEDAEVLFKDNTLIGHNLRIALACGCNSIIADNRFMLGGTGPLVQVGDEGAGDSANVQIRGNIFSRGSAEDAISVGELSAPNVSIGDNQFTGP